MLCAPAFSQEIPWFILPEDNYQGAIDDAAMQKIVSLAKDVNAGKDPSYETVSCIFPHFMDKPKAVVGSKEHHGRFLTSWDGSIIFPPMYISFEVLGSGNPLISQPTPLSSPEVEKVSHSLVGDHLPVINRVFRYDGVTYDQTVFAYAKGVNRSVMFDDEGDGTIKGSDFDTENPLIAYLRFKVKNEGPKQKTHKFVVHFQGTGSRPSTQIWANSGPKIVDCPMTLYGRDFRVVNENMDPVMWSNVDKGFFSNDSRLTITLILQPGEERNLDFCIPFEPVKPNMAKQLDDDEFDTALSKVSAFWESVIDKGMKINVPEKRINDAYAMWHINNFLLTKEDRSRMTYNTIDAPFFYEAIFGYAAAMYLNTLTVSGYFEEAKKVAKMFLRLQNDDGSISGVNRSNGIIPHQHGAILYTIAQVYRMSRDAEWFKRVAPQLIDGCDWIINDIAANTAPEGDVAHGLLPVHRCNVDNGHGTQEYSGNAWCWAGMNQVGIALKELGGQYAAEGERLLEEAARYREDILASMERAAVVEADATYIPLDIAVREPIAYMEANTECKYYAWISSRMLESMIFDKDDWRMEAYCNFFEKRKGIIMGVIRAGGRNKLSYAAHFGAGYGISNLRMGKIDRSLMNYYGMFSYGQSQNLYAPQEHDNFVDPVGDPWYKARQPHLHSGSELIRITNKMLIYEERNDICLAFGTPRAWLEDGKTIEVSNSRTCFGEVSYRIASSVDNNRIDVTINHVRSQVDPDSFQLKLRHPKGKAIRRVELDGRPVDSFDKETITLPGNISDCSVSVYYK